MAIMVEREPRLYFSDLTRSAGLDFLAGLWLFLSAFLFSGGEQILLVNNVFCGIVAALLVFGAIARAWMGLFSAAIGLWVIVSPFALGFYDTNLVATLNNVITGVVLLAVGVRSWLVRREAADTGVAPETPAS
jgi:hypothetical protein